jgi:hypothetical protein
MKAKRSTISESSSTPYDGRIDAALRVYSHAEPAPGLEGRVVAWISARQSLQPTSASRLVVMWRFFAAALAVAAACAIVAGSVQHSHHAALPQAARVQRQGGVAGAGLAHVPTQPTPESPTIDPAAPRTPAHGRATVSGDQGRHDGGAAQPSSPYSPNQQPANSQQ